MLNVNNFDGILYMSPVAVVYEDSITIRTAALDNLNNILEMCKKELDLNTEVVENDNYHTYIIKPRE